jgi:aminopeptidase N
MLDVQNAAAAPPAAIRREDYRPPDWLVPSIELEFDLDAERTRVRSRLSVSRNGAHDRPLTLDAEGLDLLELTVDGEAAQYNLDGDVLTVAVAGDAALVETLVELAPRANTQLMGPLRIGRDIMHPVRGRRLPPDHALPDRPDVLSRYRVRMIADKAPIRCCSPTATRSAQANWRAGGTGRNGTIPSPSPATCSLWSPADLAANRDSFVTRSGRKVDLGIWVREPDLPKTEHAMESLKASMKWDEEVYGREYDLAVFNIVAVADFNFGAMENKGLNIFNSRFILADPETATDADFDAVAASSRTNISTTGRARITCRDGSSFR